MTRLSVVETQPAWGQEESLWQPRRAAFWLFVGLFLVGAPVVFHRILPALGVDLAASSLAFVLWSLYALPFLLLVVALDLLEPEPPAFLGLAFAWGAIVALSLALVANTALRSILVKLGSAEFVREWGAAIMGPSTEEPLKALGIVVVILIAARQVNTVLDGLVYGAVIGLAFQVAEDFVYTIDRISTSSFAETPGRAAFEVFTLRGLGLGLWSHAVYTAIAGAGIAYFKIATDRSLKWRGFVALALLAAAWAMHFVWNTPWWGRSNPGTLGVEDIPVFLVKGIPALVLVLVLWTVARRREVVWFAGALQGERECVPSAELVMLQTMHGRRRAIRADRRRGGRPAARHRRALQRAQVRLAVANARHGPASAEAESARAEVRSMRTGVDGSPDDVGPPPG